MGAFTDKLKGRFKSVTGKATGNRRLEAEGKRDELKGKVKSGYEEVKHGIKEAERRDPKPGDY
ncbi:MAG: CsbD family protein [Myxococcaceae bacterium]